MSDKKLDLILECFLHSFQRDKLAQNIRSDLDSRLCKRIEEVLEPENERNN